MSAAPPKFIKTSTHEGVVAEWLNDLFVAATLRGASDIHMEDGESDVRVRFRINGVLETVQIVTRDLGANAILKIRGRASLPLNKHRDPADGRFSFCVPEQDVNIDVRVSLNPILFGMSMVCRILSQKNTSRRIDDIEMPPDVRGWIRTLLNEPHGLFLVTGPTGSGKTSTLYAMLNELLDDTRKIVTIEDPVEYRVQGLCQTNIEGQLSFADVLRSEMRQDPDVILVGEIRDAETASIAVQAAMTGHLVLSTLHTNDAASTVARMLDLGVDPNTLGAALRGVLAQRLVQRLHPEHDWVKASAAESDWLASHNIKELAADYGAPRIGVGNGGQGYVGRIAATELIVIDRTMRNVLPTRDAKLMRAVAKNQTQFRTLAQSAAELARAGLTSIPELFTVSTISEHLQTLRTLQDRLIELGHLSPYQYDICRQIQQEASVRGERLALEDVLIRQRYVSQEVIDEVEDI